jgi:hypothetical protein
MWLENSVEYSERQKILGDCIKIFQKYKQALNILLD